MRSTRLLTGAVLSAAALGLSAPAAYAGDFGAIDVSPATAAPGSTVTLSTTGCGTGRTASVDAGTLGGGKVTLVPGATKGALTAKLTVKPGTAPGNYGVGGNCADGKDITGTVRVTAAGASASPGMSASPSTSMSPGGRAGTGQGMSPSAKPGPAMPGKEHPGMSGGSTGPTMPPKGRMKTGEGSTSEDGLGTKEIAAGAGVLAAAAVGGVWLVRRRRAGGRY
ncbi:hypothetical protein ADL22_13385 [Streptomyces sp. NRRL F-4489]|uniref:hypothetical protein n=1 Tax=Streptomyces sp. NRRL F-4489 TaxID=1609095 RepID=UPI00074AB79F|nr:hypothetical protein [Streptomyces sp. NRRL F-4489]KUL43071.1 hypothetical protein ADL22_13385 [Streptomyces sp. NRRL F-4489]